MISFEYNIFVGKGQKGSVLEFIQDKDLTSVVELGVYDAHIGSTREHVHADDVNLNMNSALNGIGVSSFLGTRSRGSGIDEDLQEVRSSAGDNAR